MLGQFHIHDASLLVSWDASVMTDSSWSLGLTPAQWELWGRACRVLERSGFRVFPQARVSRLIRKHYRQGRHPGGLEVKTACHRGQMEFRFFQSLVRDNPHGGEYDFDRLARMPYLVRLRWRLVMDRLVGFLLERGLQAQPTKPASPVPDPLRWFNAAWGSDRFERGPDGWVRPDPLGSVDRDGVTIETGSVRYFRHRNGRLYRGRVYPNLNGQWLVLYGSAEQDWTTLSAGELFWCDPRREPRRVGQGRRTRLEVEKRKAIQAEQYERAAVLRDILRAEPA